jgi:hypothetical protein
MGINLNEMEVEDLLKRAKPYLNKMYPIRELINGKNEWVDYEFTDARTQIQLKEVQKGDLPKPDKYTVWAKLKSPNGKIEKELLSKVVQYFENLPKTD